MKLDVPHIANLADLALTPEEIKRFERQLEDTLTYINELNQIKTDGVDITYQVTGLKNITREDKTTTSLTQKEALSNAAKTTKGFFEVDGILENT